VYILFVAPDFDGHAWRQRSVDDVAKEVKHALELFPDIKEIFFDDTFTIGKSVLDLCEKFKPSTLPGLALPASTLIWKRFRQACSWLSLFIVGFESGNPQILKNIKRCNS